MGDGAEDMGLFAWDLRRPPHGLPINGNALILPAEGVQPPAEQGIDFTGVDGRDKAVKSAAARDEVAPPSLSTA